MHPRLDLERRREQAGRLRGVGLPEGPGPVRQPLGAPRRPDTRTLGRAARDRRAARPPGKDQPEGGRRSQDCGAGEPPPEAGGPRPGALASEQPIEIVPEILGAGISHGDPLLQACADDPLDVSRHVRAEPRESGRLGEEDPTHHGRGGLPLEGRSPGQDLVEHAPQAPDVRRGRERRDFPASLLGGHVGRGPEGLAGPREPRAGRDRLGQPEVRQEGPDAVLPADADPRGPRLSSEVHGVVSLTAGEPLHSRPVRDLLGLAPYFRRHAGALSAGLAAAVVADLFALLPPLVLARAVDAVAGRAPAEDVLGILARSAAGLLALVAVAGTATWAARRLLLGTSRLVERELQTEVFARLLRLPAATHERLRTGDVFARLTSDLSAVRDVLGPGLMHATEAVTYALVATALMLATSPRLTLYALAPLPFLAVASAWSGTVTHRLSRVSQEAYGAVAQRAATGFAAIRVIAAFRREEAERAAFCTLDETYARTSLQLARVRALYLPVVAGLPGLAVAGILWAGGREVMDGRLGYGALAAFVWYVLKMVSPLVAFGWVVTLGERGAASFGRLRELLAEPPEEAGGPPPAAPTPVRGLLEWRGVTLGRGTGPATVPVLRDLALRVEPGAFVAVVGPVGAGKSTLLATVPRLVEPPRGTVFFDGRDVRDWPLAHLRAAAGLVAQDPFLFGVSVRENIALARPSASPEEVARAAEEAGLGPDLAAWPDGIGTVVGERGVTVSGGQRQRIALARALLADPPALLLDDVFSSLDAETAAGVLARIRERRRGRTTLLATHRLQAAAAADEVVVLVEGRVADRGPHATLVARPGPYARMIERARIEEEVEAR